MPLNDQIPEYWLEIAAHDLESTQILDRGNGPRDVIIYHYHQCIEKILKSEIVKSKTTTPRIHDLERLFSHIDTVQWQQLAEPIIVLNTIAQNIRYPQGDQIEESQFQMAKIAFMTILDALAPQLAKSKG
jgi:HEPN domain-containing protein